MSARKTNIRTRMSPDEARALEETILALLEERSYGTLELSGLLSLHTSRVYWFCMQLARAGKVCRLPVSKNWALPVPLADIAPVTAPTPGAPLRQAPSRPSSVTVSSGDAALSWWATRDAQADRTVFTREVVRRLPEMHASKFGAPTTHDNVILAVDEPNIRLKRKLQAQLGAGA